MKKIARLLFILSIVPFLTGCEETKDASQSTINNYVELHQNKSMQSQVTSSIEVYEDVENDESDEKKAIQSDIGNDVSEESQSGDLENQEALKKDESVVEEYVVVEPVYEEIVVGEVKEGNVITFGRYEQDNNLENGDEPIEWRVLEVSDERATLIPTKMLMCGTGIESYGILEEFSLEAFNDNERKLIVEGPAIISESFLDSYLSLILIDNNGWKRYKQSEMFEGMKTYTDSVIASGLKCNYVHVSGSPDKFYHYIIWIEDHAAFWTDSNNSGQEAIGTMPISNRSTNGKTIYGILPYIVILIS